MCPRAIPTGSWSRPKRATDSGEAGDCARLDLPWRNARSESRSPHSSHGRSVRSRAEAARRHGMWRNGGRPATWRAVGAVRPRRSGPAAGFATPSSSRSTGATSTAGARTITRPPSRPSWRAAGRSPVRRNPAGRDPPDVSARCTRSAAARCARARSARRRARNSSRTNFRPVRIAKLGESAGFLTGYYEPIVDGSRFPTRDLPRADLSPPARSAAAGRRAAGAGFPNTGQSRARATATASSCPTTTAARSRTARSTASISRSAGSRTRPTRCSSRSRARRASGSRTALIAARSTTTATTAIPTRRSAAS